MASYQPIPVPKDLNECREVPDIAVKFLDWSERVRTIAYVALVLSIIAGLIAGIAAEEFWLVLVFAVGGFCLMASLMAYALFLEAKGTELAYLIANTYVNIYESSKHEVKTEKTEAAKAAARPAAPKTQQKAKTCPICGETTSANRSYCESCGSTLI